MEQILFIIFTLLLFVTAFPGIGKTAKHAGQLVIDNQRKLIIGANLAPIREPKEIISPTSDKIKTSLSPEKYQFSEVVDNYVNNFSLTRICGMVRPKRPP